MESNFVLTLPLEVESWQADILDKRYEYLRVLYNYVQGKLLRQFSYFKQMNEYSKSERFRDKLDFLKSHTFNIDGIVGRNKLPLDINFTEYGVRGFVTKLAQKKTGSKSYKELGINSTNLASLSSNIWSAWDKYIYGKGSKIHFKRKDELNSIEYPYNSIKKGFIGLEVDLAKMEIHFKLNGNNGLRAKWMTLKVGKNKFFTEYEISAFNLGEESIRTVTIVRKSRNGNRKYYVQLTFRGNHDNKGRKLGKGQVGIDIGPSTVAISSLYGVRIDKLANKVDNIEHEKWILQRKLDRSRRKSNPQNYNQDGTIKRGVKLVWAYSNRYKKLLIQLKELQRHQAAIRKEQHIEMANELLSLGDIFVVENNPILQWAAKAKETKKSEKTGKYLRKKRFGKSVANHAPSEFVTILKNKVLSLGGSFFEVDVRNAASRYDFTNKTFQAHGLGERRVTLSNGDIHQRDLMAAFNLQHLKVESDELKDYDVESMLKDYETFCLLERKELEKYKVGIKINDKSTIDAF